MPSVNAIQKLINEAIGAVFSALVTKDFDEQVVAYPSNNIDIENIFQNKMEGIYKFISLKTQENKKLSEMNNLLLSKLATIEN